MRSPLRAAACTALLVLGLAACSASDPLPADPSPDTPAQSLRRAHAHNDYEHDRPLLDALDAGFASVEADVYTDPLGVTDLYVAHDPQDIQLARTLRTLYLDPLAQRVEERGGSVHGDGRPFYLLIDIKTEAESTYALVDQQLREYASMLTRLTADTVTPGAITVQISGNRPADTMRAQADRYAGYDGRMSDLDSIDSPAFMPLISDNWTRFFSWNGAGPMPAAERAMLHDQVSRIHAAGRRVRYWSTPDTAGPERDAVWHELLCAGVDHLNTDDLAGLRAFLVEHDPPDGC